MLFSQGGTRLNFETYGDLAPRPSLATGLQNDAFVLGSLPLSVLRNVCVFRVGASKRRSNLVGGGAGRQGC